MICLPLPSSAGITALYHHILLSLKHFKIYFLNYEYVCVCGASRPCAGVTGVLSCLTWVMRTRLSPARAPSGPSLQPIFDALKMFKIYYSACMSNREFECRWHSAFVEVRGQLSGVASPSTWVPQITLRPLGATVSAIYLLSHLAHPLLKNLVAISSRTLLYTQMCMFLESRDFHCSSNFFQEKPPQLILPKKIE